MKLSTILIAGVLVCASSMSSQDEWPGVSYVMPVWELRPTSDGRQIVAIPNIIGEQMHWIRYFPNAVPLRLTVEQARAIAQVYDQMQDERRHALMAREAAEATGDPDQIARAMEQYLYFGSFENDLLAEMVKERLTTTLTAEQMDTVKALCINAVLHHYRFDDILLRGFELCKIKPDDEEMIELRMAIIESEFELRKEMIELQKRAWDKIMGKLPKEVVQAIEADFGFDGLSVKTK